MDRPLNDGLRASFVTQIQEQILSGKLRPGDRLPPERRLAALYGISRGSVNQGILDLERMGFVRVAPRKGAFIADYVKHSTPDTLTALMSYDSSLIDSSLFRDLMAFRMLVEQESARLACRNMTKEKAKRLRERLSSILSCSVEDAPEAFYHYHAFLTELSGNAAYAMVFHSFRKMIIGLMREHFRSAEELEKTRPHYAELTEALIRRDALDTSRLMGIILGKASEYLDRLLKAREKDKGDRT